MALEPFIWGAGGARLTPEQIAREREIAQSLMGVDTSPVGHWLQGAARMANAGVGALRNYRAGQAEQTNAAENQSALSRVLGAFGGGTSGGSLGGSPATSTSMATAPAPDIASARVAQAHGGGFDGDLRSGIISTAEAIGADPIDLATAISYETAGTFDPLKKGPTTQWGQHRGLIQFGEPQAAQHGVDWNDPLGSQLGPNGAVANYFRSSGFQPGMSGLDLYSTINAGAPGRYNRSDANNGGAPGNVRDKWENQMAGHRQKALSLIGDYAPGGAVAANEAMASGDLTAQAVQNWAAQNYAPEGVTVAETPDQIMAAEQAMASPEFAAPPMAEPRMVQDIPVADAATGPQGMGDGTPGETRRGPDGRLYQYAQTSGMAGATGDWGWIPVADGGGGFADVARALTGATVNPDLPMMGGRAGGGFLPAQQQAAQGQQTGGFSPELIQLVSSPYVDSNTRQIAMSLLGQQMQQADPMRQLQMQKAQLELQQMQNPQAKPIEVGGVLLDPNTMQPIFDSRQQNDPASVQEYQFYANQAAQSGQQPLPYDQWDIARRQSGATNISVGGEGAPGLGKLSPDYGYVLDPNSRQPVIDPVTGLPQAAPVPGSPADIAMQEAERMRSGQEGQSQRYGKIVGEDIGRVLAAVEENPNTIAGPLGSLLASVPGTGAHDVSNMLNTIRANVGFDRLQDMRANSPTGGALGAVSDSENKMLQSTLGALEQSQSPKQFATNLRRLQNLYTEIVHGPAPNGISDDEWTKQAWGLGASQRDGAPAAGSVVDGYRFKGGDPADPNSWEKQ